MIIETRSPCRADLAGGTLDIWPLYLFHSNGVTVNFAVNVCTSCRIETRSDARIVLRARDQNLEEIYSDLAALEAAPRPRNSLAAAVIRHFRPAGGFELTTHSESPKGAGIAGSSSLFISTVSALNRLCGTGHGLEAIRQIAQNIEAQLIRAPTGCQDYYPALYGGVCAVELGVAGIRRRLLAADPDELNRRFLLAYTGEPRESGINNWEVTKAHIDGDRRVWRNFDQIAAIAYAMQQAIEANNFAEAGRLLRAEWNFRRRNSPGITTPIIDRLVALTRRKGALGAKVCGAGGGGCVVFLVEPDAKERVAQAIQAEGAHVLRTRVALKGVTVKAKA
jgi:D-glycero-alpha-D-manno-heptose-7-phosphate kinase